MQLRNAWDSYPGRLTIGFVVLFVVFPLLGALLGHLASRALEGCQVGVLVGTGGAVLWYTVETHYLRHAMVRANEIAVFPLVIARVESVEVSGGPPVDRVVLRNIGKGPALYVKIPDYVVEGSTSGSFDVVDLIEAEQQVAVKSVVHSEFGDVPAVAHLKPSYPKPCTVEISYEDISRGKHRSVMQLGRGGPRLLRHFALPASNIK